MTTTLADITGNHINGQRRDGSGKAMDITSPLDGNKISEIRMSSIDDVDSAVQAAKKALPGWKSKTLKQRVQYLYKFRNLYEQSMEELARIVHLENGKAMPDARAEVAKGLELTEFACSLPQFINDEVQVVSRGIECRTTHEPVGIVASITPFNFPSMVPLWTLPNAIALGNCMILKPSEKVPLSAIKIVELMYEAGIDPGVINLVNGEKEVVEAICDHPDIEAVTFVGSTKVAKIVYRRATHHYKRCIALGGAKNHLFVLPDAHLDMAENIVSSMAGSAGQRCMAASVLVMVGKHDQMLDSICDIARSYEPGTDSLGSVISHEARQRIEGYIDEAEAAGAKVLVDGRKVEVEGKEGGSYVGATVIDHVTPDMKIAQEEVFGPVLSVIRAKDVDEALEIENASNYGNAASVFTQNGSMANYILDRASAGMVGVNVGVPVPREPFSFGGWNDSSFGANDITGKDSIGFWTKLKKRTTKWNAEDWTDWMS